MEVGINYLQLLNGPQMEALALYNAVWVVNNLLSAGTVKSAKQHWDRGFNQWQALQFWHSRANDQQERFFYKLYVEYIKYNI